MNIMLCPNRKTLAVAAPFALAAALLAVTSTVRAQAVAAAETPKEEIVTMSRFDVKESSDNSYGVTSATAGLKSNQPLIEISSPIQVLPRILMENLGVNWLTTDYARFVSSGLNSYGANNQFYLRGQRVTPMFKNGVQYFSSVDDAFSVETVEVVKGVNSSLFGSMPQVSGMVMESTKIPLSVSKNTLGISGLADGAVLRAELDSTGPLGKELFGAKASYRFLAVGQNNTVSTPERETTRVVCGTNERGNSRVERRDDLPPDLAQPRLRPPPRPVPRRELPPAPPPGSAAFPG